MKAAEQTTAVAALPIRPYPCQQLAVLSALFCPVTLVLGPPGTGKTETVGWILLVLWENLCRRRKQQILVTAHSNKALDQIVLRLIELFDRTKYLGGENPAIVRFGHVKRMDPAVAERYSVEALLREARKTHPSVDRRSLIRHLAKSAHLVCMTTSGAAMRRFSSSDHRFSAILIEEAAKVTQPETLALLSYHPQRCIMVGDPVQLSPVVKDKYIKRRTALDVSMFSRLQCAGVVPVHMDIQGRALPEICNLYRWRYSSLHDMPHTHTHKYDWMPAVAFVDCDTWNHPTAANEKLYAENGEERETSTREAEIVEQVFRILTSRGIPETHISVITPYRKQKHHILAKRSDGFNPAHIATIDEFQGSQNDVILISLVINGRSPTPFLCDQRRINVMTSRSRQGIFFIGQRSAFAKCPAWQTVMGIISAYELRSVTGAQNLCDLVAESRWTPQINISYLPQKIFQDMVPTSMRDIVLDVCCKRPFPRDEQEFRRRIEYALERFCSEEVITWRLKFRNSLEERLACLGVARFSEVASVLLVLLKNESLGRLTRFLKMSDPKLLDFAKKALFQLNKTR